MIVTSCYSVIAKAIHSFARISDELYLEVDSTNGLSLRVMNMTKTSIVSIQFKLDFFRSFTVESKPSNPYKDKCKLLIKTYLGAFRKLERVSFVFCIQQGTEARIFIFKTLLRL